MLRKRFLRVRLCVGGDRGAIRAGVRDQIGHQDIARDGVCARIYVRIGNAGHFEQHAFHAFRRHFVTTDVDDAIAPAAYFGPTPQ